MAGKGQRFVDVGIDTPKPFIKIKGKPMIEVAVDNIGLDAFYIYIMQKAHLEEYSKEMDKIFSKHPGVVVAVDEEILLIVVAVDALVRLRDFLYMVSFNPPEIAFVTQ